MTARFHSPLIAEFPIRGRTRILQSDLVYSSKLVGLIRVPIGFQTDFASVPRLPLAFLFAGDIGHYAAVVHDWLYSAGSGCMSRRLADEVFLEALKASGVSDLRRIVMWCAVRAFGGRFWRGK
jgi:hypothetical protein